MVECSLFCYPTEMDDLQIVESDGERKFLQYLHGYPGEPEWLSVLLDEKQALQEPEKTEIQQVSLTLLAGLSRHITSKLVELCHVQA